MPKLVFRGSHEFESGFADVRKELDVADKFPDDVQLAAEKATIAPGERIDARDVEFAAIDPPGATDLDQAFAAKAIGEGFQVSYAIADVGAFVQPGDPVDIEARLRGSTLYSPDQRTPLHPPTLSEDRASLLPGQDRPALLWTIDLDGEGKPTDARLEKAWVKVREAISYSEAQKRIDTEAVGEPTSLHLLKQIGLLRQAREVERGGISLNLPAQEVVKNGTTYDLEFDTSLPVEGWNAQISLLTGIVAGNAMADAGVGLLRTLPKPQKDVIAELRLTAEALGIDWPDQTDYPTFIRTLTPNDPACNALLVQAARTFRGAGYVSFDGAVPEHPTHGAIASLYSHVTAPLRRLVDRFSNEILLAIYAGTTPPAWALEASSELPSLMAKARHRESALERAMVDFAEALILQSQVGEIFDGVVVNIREKPFRATVQLKHPAVVAHIDAEGRKLAEHVRLKLESADVQSRSINFAVV